MCAEYEKAKLIRRAVNLGVGEGTKAQVFPGGTGQIITSAAPDHVLDATFGLLPHWAKPALARSTYNARSETIAEKPSFRSAWRLRQFCVIPAQAFFEPSYETGKAVRWRIERADGQSFGIAGIYERVMPAGEPSRWSFSMVTINATGHPLMDRFHAPGDEKRSVVVLDHDDWDAWLNARSESDARSLLLPIDPALMTAAPAPRPPRLAVVKYV